MCSRALAPSLCLSLLALFSIPGVAFADPGQLYVGTGIELWPKPDVGGHGYGMVTYRQSNVWRGADIDLTFNTDTLMASARDLYLVDNLRLGGFIKGEVIFSGLLTDYYQRAELIPGRGFAAHYIQGGVQLDIYDAPLFTQLEIGGRRWAFQPRESTSKYLVTPPDMWVFEPRLRLTHWEIDSDRSISEPHRHYWRVSGWGAGLELGADYRLGWERWGELENLGVDDPSGLRNARGNGPLMARLWLKGGQRINERARVQSAFFISLGQNEDDLTRSRVGGMNPYVVPVAGLPWASYLPENFGALQLSSHIKVRGEHEVGLLFDYMQLSEADALRVNKTRENDGLGANLKGLGLFADMRWGDGWQAHARFGYALPSDLLSDNLHLSGWASLGKQIF